MSRKGSLRRLAFGAGALCVLGGAYMLLSKKKDEGTGTKRPCAIEGSTACMSEGTANVPYKCVNREWVKSADSTICTNDKCPYVADKCGSEGCEGDDLTAPGSPRCIMVGDTPICNRVVKYVDYPACVHRYPVFENTKLYINGQVQPEYPASTMVQGSRGDCPATGACQGFSGLKNQPIGVELAMGLFVGDQWGEGLENVLVELNWNADSNLGGFFITDYSGRAYCGGGVNVCDSPQILMRTASNGVAGRDRGGMLDWVQLVSGSDGTLYNLNLAFTVHDPTGVRSPFTKSYKITIRGLMNLLDLGNTVAQHTCQFYSADQRGCV